MGSTSHLAGLGVGRLQRVVGECDERAHACGRDARVAGRRTHTGWQRGDRWRSASQTQRCISAYVYGILRSARVGDAQNSRVSSLYWRFTCDHKDRDSGPLELYKPTEGSTVHTHNTTDDTPTQSHSQTHSVIARSGSRFAVRGSRDLPSDLASANISEILSEYQARGGLGLGGLLVGSGLSLKLIKGRIHLASAMEVTQRCASVSLLRRSTWCHATPRIQLYAKHLHDGGGGDGGGDGGGAPAHHNTPILGAHRSRAEVLCVRGQGESLQVFEESTPIAFPTAPDPTGPSARREPANALQNPRHNDHARAQHTGAGTNHARKLDELAQK